MIIFLESAFLTYRFIKELKNSVASSCSMTGEGFHILFPDLSRNYSVSGCLIYCQERLIEAEQAC
jgi:hypothetical protein